MLKAIVELTKKEADYTLAGLASLIRTDTPEEKTETIKELMRKILQDIFFLDESIIEKGNCLNSYVALSGFNCKIQ